MNMSMPLNEFASYYVLIIDISVHVSPPQRFRKKCDKSYHIFRLHLIEGFQMSVNDELFIDCVE